MNNLILPRHIGDARYGKNRAAPQGVEDPGNESRPLLHQEEVAGRVVIVANAPEMTWRMPVDEMKAMAQDAEKRRVRRGDAQKQADWAMVFREWWEDRRNSAWDRRNGRQSFGYATFRGNRAR